MKQSIKDHDHFSLDNLLASMSPLLPHQGPIKNFIHQNTLQVFLDQPFEEAVLTASELYGAAAYMDLSFYRDKYAKKEISAAALDEAIARRIKNVAHQAFIKDALFNFEEILDEHAFFALVNAGNFSLEKTAKMKSLAETAAPKGSAKKSLRQQAATQLNYVYYHDVNAILFRLLASYLDQGIALWPALEKSPSFLEAVAHLAKHSALSLAPFVDNHDLLTYLSLPPDEAIHRLLENIVASPSMMADYLKEALLEHPGWSGMINVIEHQPQTLAKERPISLKELLVVKLALEWQAIKHHDPDFKPLTLSDGHHEAEQKLDEPSTLALSYWLLSLPKEEPAPLAALPFINSISLQRIWHDALEEDYYRHIRQSFAKNLARAKSPKTGKEFQAVFCIDDRECSIRRHLEAESSQIETLSFPGFFGIDCYFKAHKKDLLEKLCPVPVTPKHVVLEKVHSKEEREGLVKFASYMAHHGANSILWGFIAAYTIGHLSLFRLFLSFLHPFKLRRAQKLSRKTSLIFRRESDDSMINGLWLGYSESEMADRVYNVLTNMGLYRDFAPLVFFIGHGSNSANNPHFAAYDCGACSGRPGIHSGRIFAAMANLPSVRERVKEKGLAIPRETVFIGGYHDTCTDDLSFFDTEQLSRDQARQFQAFLGYLESALKKNAQERCQKFAMAPANISGGGALAEVLHRSKALFEPRPELCHASNALCVIGRRDLSYGMNFERRAFLQSYDPTIDPEGRILATLLSAIIPVCGGINLEYYFSRIDPAIYGCGTKLSHNVVGLLGVGNGLDDDLRTGLPIQMTELHEPIRLLIVIEQTENIVRRALEANGPLLPWVKNEWLRIECLDPGTKEMRLFEYQIPSSWQSAAPVL